METDKRKKPLPGAWLMRGGLQLMAAALFLTGFNLWDESRARRAADRIEARMPRAAEDSRIPADAGEVEIPDYLLNPNMEMPEIQILQPGDVEEMLSGGWALTLFTCTLGGRTRVTVRCEEAADAGRGYGLSI